MNRDELLQSLTAADFFIIDLGLYLNTHPDDREAVAKYNEMVRKAKELRNQYEEEFGMLMVGATESKCPWQWVEDPWPWQYEFNFELRGDDM